MHEKVWLFEKTHSLEQIRTAALRMMCGKIDKDYVRRIKTKEQLLDYLHSCKCPALAYLEASLFPFNRVEYDAPQDRE